MSTNLVTEQFIGFHGTVEKFAQILTQGVFDPAWFGANTPGGVERLQLGEGLYVVKAENPSDDTALGLAEFFGLIAQQNHQSPMVIFDVYAHGFDEMTRLTHIGGRNTLSLKYLDFDYVESQILNWDSFTQIKFSPHVFKRLRFERHQVERDE